MIWKLDHIVLPGRC